MSLRLPFYYPPNTPSLAASREAVLEEAIEEPEDATAEPSSRREAVDVEELSSIKEGVVTAEPTPVSIPTDFADATSFASHRERSPRRDIRVPPKAPPRPSQTLRPLFCTLPAQVEAYNFVDGTLVSGRGVRKPPIGAPCLFLDYHNTLNRTAARGNVGEGQPIPEVIVNFLSDLKARVPFLVIFVLSFLVAADRRALFERSIGSTVGADRIFAAVLTCASKRGPRGKAAVIRSIANVARAALVDDAADVCGEAHCEGVKAFHILLPRREWALDAIDWGHDLLQHYSGILKWATAVEQNRW